MEILLTHGSPDQLEVVKLNFHLFFHLLYLSHLFVMIPFYWLLNDKVIVVLQFIHS